MSPSRRSAFCVGLVAALLPLVSACVPPAIRITSPPHGMFVSAGSSGVVVKGTLADVDPADASVTVNGVVAQIDATNKTFTAVVPFGAPRLFEPIVAELTRISSGRRARDRIVVIRELDIGETTAVQDAVALRIRQGGLDDIAPVVTALLEPQLDPAALLPQDAIESDGATIDILEDPPATLGGVTLAFDSVPGAVDVTAVLSDIFIAARLDKPTFPQLHCSIEVSIGSLTVKARQQLEPGGTSGETIAVQQVPVSAGSEVLVTPSGLSSVADCTGPGLFDDAKAKKVRELIQTELAGAIADFLADPDGPSEPQSAPISAVLETQLAGLDLASIAVPGLRSTIDARFTAIDEQDTQIDARFAVDVDPKKTELPFSAGLGATRALVFKPDPNLSGSLRVPGIYPTFATAIRHDIAVGLSFSGLNRLLMSETESRRFQIVIDEVTSGGTTVPFTASTLSMIPEFAALPPDTALRARIKATLAPVLTGNAGPHGELLEVQVAHVVVSVAKLVTNAQGQTTESEQVRLAIDARAGVDLSLANGVLTATLGTLEQGDITVAVLANQIGANEALLEVFGPIVLASELPEIVGTAASFPLPALLDLSVQGKLIQRKDGYLLVFANLVATP